MKRAYLTGGVVAAIILALGWLSYPRFETARLWYAVIGVDVSHHQGRIDWPKVAESGVSFAYVKATEGGDFVDANFRENWDNARATGIAVGAYHFFRRCKGGREQAENFLKALPPEAGQLPPVIDVEDMGTCPRGTPALDPAAEIAVLLDEVEARAGCRPTLYVTSEFDAAYLGGKLGGEKFWVRSIFLLPSFRTGSWIIWQYHHFGRRPGIIGAVDLNAFRGGAEDFAAYRTASGCFRSAA